jgi:precorrin-6x reductase|tara:strand:+ start:509 stop:802 length:294 start_codon:yes stop_codon:yes gene_type:complete
MIIEIPTIIIILLSVVCIILGFTTLNLLRKNEKAEDIVVGYLEYLDKISRVIEAAEAKVKKIDIKGSFASDDEIGFFFKQIKQIQNILNEFQLKKFK